MSAARKERQRFIAPARKGDLVRQLLAEAEKPCVGAGGDSYRVRKLQVLARAAADALTVWGRPNECRRAQARCGDLFTGSAVLPDEIAPADQPPRRTYHARSPRSAVQITEERENKNIHPGAGTPQGLPAANSGDLT